MAVESEPPTVSLDDRVPRTSLEVRSTERMRMMSPEVRYDRSIDRSTARLHACTSEEVLQLRETTMRVLYRDVQLTAVI